jgi:hypothetical protein
MDVTVAVCDGLWASVIESSKLLRLKSLVVYDGQVSRRVGDTVDVRESKNVLQKLESAPPHQAPPPSTSVFRSAEHHSR